MLWCYAKTDEDDNVEVDEDVCESGAAMTVMDMLIIAVMLSGMIVLVVEVVMGVGDGDNNHGENNGEGDNNQGDDESGNVHQMVVMM